MTRKKKSADKEVLKKLIIRDGKYVLMDKPFYPEKIWNFEEIPIEHTRKVLFALMETLGVGVNRYTYETGEIEYTVHLDTKENCYEE